MTLARLQNIVITLFVVLALVSLRYCAYVQLLDYMRFFVLGMTILLVYVTMTARFSTSYFCLALLAAGYAYLIYLCDGAVNGSIFFTHIRAPVFNTYRVISLVLLFGATIAMIITIVPDADRRTQFMAAWRKRDMYVAITLAALMAATVALEILQTDTLKSSIYEAFLRGTKWIDYFLVYILVVTAFSPETEKDTPTHRVRLLLFVLLGTCGFVSMVAAGKASAAYVGTRVPHFPTERRLNLWFPSFPEEVREKFLSVFSLNSREALLIYEAGYRAGKQEHEEAQEILQRVQRIGRPTLTEKQIEIYVAQGDFSALIPVLDSFPFDYTFSPDTMQKLLPAIQQYVSSPPVSTPLLYVAGILAHRSGHADDAQAYLTAFLHTHTNHANALFFYHTGDPTALSQYPRVTLPARHWLATPDTTKPLEYDGSAIQMMYNQHVEGHVWLTPGRYTMTIWARDSGTPYEVAKDTPFDPTCKARVWAGNTFFTLDILSTNRQFLGFSRSLDVTAPPTHIIIEFINDMFDATHGWDRNLSISHIDFIRENGDL